MGKSHLQHSICTMDRQIDIYCLPSIFPILVTVTGPPVTPTLRSNQVQRPGATSQQLTSVTKSVRGSMISRKCLKRP